MYLGRQKARMIASDTGIVAAVAAADAAVASVADTPSVEDIAPRMSESQNVFFDDYVPQEWADAESVNAEPVEQKEAEPVEQKEAVGAS